MTATARRAGFSLVELMVALTIFSILMLASLGSFRGQGQAFSEGNERMTLQQNLRYGISSLEQHLRALGVGLPSHQPFLVYADTSVVAFNANYATNIQNDLFAYYYDPQLPNDAVNSLTKARRFQLPRSSFSYPDTTYFVGAGYSAGETIIFYFEPDPFTARTDDYVLYRQLNDQPPEVIARHLLHTGSQPFFRYYSVDASDAATPVDAVPLADLPLAHTEPVHGSTNDVGTVALVDSVRAVRVAFTATNGQTGAKEQRREISRLLRLPNAGIATPRNCGNRPLLGSISFTGTRVTIASSDYGVRLEWYPATDETSGEMDVQSYVIWRKHENDDSKAASVPWGDPFLIIPAGTSTPPYVYVDDVPVNGDYYYAIAAMDCTPQYSALAETGLVHAH